MSRADANTQVEISLAEPIPRQFAVGRGQYQVLQGEIYCGGMPVHEVCINQSAQRACRVELFEGSHPGTLEFFISILWEPADVGESHSLVLKLIGGAQGQAEFELGNVFLVEASSSEVDILPGSTLGDSPLLAICMATYNPDSSRLVRQVESILCQHYENWLLIISDDNSDKLCQDELESLCKLDPRRIRLYCHEQNLGFYHNFERALGYVPGNARLVALSDQDDEWYPEKLDRLLDELNTQAETVLAYSDMRIVSESGEIISNTYWQNRKNEYRDFNTVFIANTVTGAASLFKRELLDVVLPFPERIGGAFHDHWIACCAMSVGRLAYITEPLYDYIQYPDSVIGHCDFNSGEQKDLKVAASPDKWQHVYRHECLRLQYIAGTLKTRLPDMASNQTLNLMNGGFWSAIKLIKAYLAGGFMRRTTNGVEPVLMMGLLRGKGD